MRTSTRYQIVLAMTRLGLTLLAALVLYTALGESVEYFRCFLGALAAVLIIEIANIK